MPDSITIGGLPGSGTTTTAKRLHERLDMPYVYAGDMFRAMAEERDMTLAEFGAYCEEHSEIDRSLDQKQKVILMAGNVILESRLAGWIAHKNYIPSFKIWLTCDADERARRLAEREDEPIEQMKQEMQEREQSEKKRYRDYYDIDLDDLSIYDVVIGTTDVPPPEVVETALAAMSAI
jgi:cytidylate kinase